MQKRHQTEIEPELHTWKIRRLEGSGAGICDKTLLWEEM